MFTAMGQQLPFRTNRVQRYNKKMTYANKNKHTKSVYILCIYTVEAQKMQKMQSMLWVSYGYVMGILWCG